MSLASQDPNRPRPRIGRYLVVGRIGKGGMGMVYRALDEALEREVALKTLTAEGVFDAESRRRFEIEAKAAARLQHPNIVTVYELGEDRGIPFIAMELVPGSDLEGLMRSGEALLLPEKLEIVIQVLRGLAFAHERGIVHRDVKPSNIRVLDDGSAKILDFGIAKLGGLSVTRTGMMVGTVYYMSPEQIRGQPLDGRSDVFSVGVILHELLAGRRPFTGETPTEVLYKIVNEPAPPLGEEYAPVAPGLAAILARALAKDAAQRFTALELAEALGEVLAGCSADATAGEVELVAESRRLLRAEGPERAMQRLRELTRTHPGSVELRRALRAAAREASARGAPGPGAAGFPELESTFRSPTTVRSPETVATAGPVPEPARVPDRRRPPWLPAAAVALVAIAAATLALWRPWTGAGGGGAASSDNATGVSAGTTGVSAGTTGVSAGTSSALGAPLRLTLRSRPPGAAVLLDGQPTSVTTPGVLTLPSGAGPFDVRFRLQGYREARREVTLPLPPDTALEVELTRAPRKLGVRSDPPGASVVLDGVDQPERTPLEVELEPGREHRLTLALPGYRREEHRLAADAEPGELSVTLVPLGPPGRVRIASSFPLDVAAYGRSLAQGATAPLVELPAGSHELHIVAREVFLDARVPVEVRGGEQVVVAAPELGRLSIRAVPDNCEISIDGRFVDYPPVLDKPVVAGRHVVSFRWPDGSRREEVSVIEPGKIAYVTGRKD